jgi:hypothetical protein
MESSISAEEATTEAALAKLPEAGNDGGVEPLQCVNPYKSWIEITSRYAYHVPSWWNGTEYKDSPGETVTVAVTQAGEIAAEVTVGWKGEVNAIAAKAKVEVSGKVSGKVTVSVGHTYSHKMSAG